jgi:hypothetical protein
MKSSGWDPQGGAVGVDREVAGENSLGSSNGVTWESLECASHACTFSAYNHAACGLEAKLCFAHQF